ncbi:MAG: DapH/DapD/GlmU-related protein [Lentisphaeria bacterium]|jgi:acetyltransferase-like isoleucine patch superfamily enzyme/GT2 family glycosyltransferase
MRTQALQLFFVTRYPEFFVDLVVSRLLFLAMRLSGGMAIGKDASIRGLPIISLAASSSIRIGNHAYLISRPKNTALGVNHPVILRTLKPDARLQIGDHFKASGVTICAAQSVTIGNRVMMGANVTVVDTDFHSSDPAVRFSPRDAEMAKTAAVTIGDDVFVGMNAMIMKGVSIGNAAIIGAGAVVVKDVPAGTIVAGNPAKIVSTQAPRQGIIRMEDRFTFVVIPTFKEKEKMAAFLRCFSQVTENNVWLLVANGNPGDETSELLRQTQSPRVLELPGNPELFWSGLVNLGLRHVLEQETDPEFVIIMNADVEFEGKTLAALLAKARANPDTQLAAVTVAGDRVVSSGVKVVSWFLTRNRHPLAGTRPEDLPPDALIPADFLPTRCTLIPFAAVKKAGVIAEKELPHYGGDNEYTNRVRKLGYPTYIFTGSQVRVDAQNTGTNVFYKSIPLGKRLHSLFSIKSPANPIYRLRFVRLAYPWYAWPSAMFLYTARSLLEVLLGGAAIKSLFRHKEAGFSGS